MNTAEETTSATNVSTFRDTAVRIRMKNDIHEALGLQPRSKEATDRYMERVATALHALAEKSSRDYDKAIGKLPDDTRAWINEKLGLGLPIAGATTTQSNGAQMSDGSEEVTTTVTETTATKPESDKPVAAEPKRRENTSRKGHVTAAIKRIIFSEPNMSIDDLKKALLAANVHASDSTVGTVRADFLHSLRVVIELGVQLPAQFKDFK